MDARGRLAATTENGARTSFTLDERGRIIAAASADATRGYTATHNARGQTASLRSGNREVAFEYDARGNQTAFTYSDVGRFETERDAAGRSIAEHLPSGLSWFNEYDARGFLLRQRDTRGRAVTIERDASGAPIAFIRADGRRMRAVRDAAGRVIEETRFDGSVRRFVYDARGALTEFINERGERRSFEYDRRGCLRSITDTRGRRTVERDERGRIRRIVNERHKPSARAATMQEEVYDFGDEEWIYTTTYPYWGLYSGGVAGINGDGSMYLAETMAGNEGADGGGSIETYEECATRRTAICNKRHHDRVYELIGGAILAGALDATVGLTVIGLSRGALTTQVIFIGALIALGIVAYTAYQLWTASNEWRDCMEDIWDLCKNQPGAPATPPSLP